MIKKSFLWEVFVCTSFEPLIPRLTCTIYFYKQIVNTFESIKLYSKKKMWCKISNILKKKCTTPFLLYPVFISKSIHIKKKYTIYEQNETIDSNTWLLKKVGIPNSEQTHFLGNLFYRSYLQQKSSLSRSYALSWVQQCLCVCLTYTFHTLWYILLCRITVQVDWRKRFVALIMQFY